MHDCVTCSKFTTKPRLRELFSNLWHLRVIFMWEFFLSWLLWEFVLDKIYKLYFSKRGLVVKRAGVMSTCIRAIAQSSVGKKMATGTFTHSSQRTKTLKTFIKRHRRVVKSSNLRYTMSLVQGQLL